MVAMMVRPLLILPVVGRALPAAAPLDIAAVHGAHPTMLYRNFQSTCLPGVKSITEICIYMRWEYKRVLFPGDLVIGDLHQQKRNTRYSSNGSIAHPDAPDPVEDYLNELGNEGWELTATTLVDGAQNSQFFRERCIIEYIFKRPK